jgi:hypothetical protein
MFEFFVLYDTVSLNNSYKVSASAL